LAGTRVDEEAHRAAGKEQQAPTVSTMQKKEKRRTKRKSKRTRDVLDNLAQVLGMLGGRSHYSRLTFSFAQLKEPISKQVLQGRKIGGTKVQLQSSDQERKSLVYVCLCF
jgi:hypothetical protein